MSAAEAQRFVTSAETDTALGERIAAAKNDPTAIHAIVRAAGFDCTPEEIREAFLEAHGAELTPEQLDAVAGGLTQGEATAVVAITIVATPVVMAASAAI